MVSYFQKTDTTRTDFLSDSDEPAWIIDQAKARKRREMLRHREDMEARLARIRTKEKAQRDKYMKGDQGFKKRKVDANKTDNGDEEQFVLEDYDSDQENGSKGGKSGGTFSAATLELMAKIGMGPVAAKEEEDETEDDIKVSGQNCPSGPTQLT
jgi:chromosome transmission fidelity protein 1